MWGTVSCLPHSKLVSCKSISFRYETTDRVVWKFEPGTKKRDSIFCLSQRNNPIVVLLSKRISPPISKKELHVKPAPSFPNLLSRQCQCWLENERAQPGIFGMWTWYGVRFHTGTKLIPVSWKWPPYSEFFVICRSWSLFIGSVRSRLQPTN